MTAYIVWPLVYALAGVIMGSVQSFALSKWYPNLTFREVARWCVPMWASVLTVFAIILITVLGVFA